jgi:hypothetical protein
MGRFYSSYEVASIFSLQPHIVAALPIHKCPRGFTTDELVHFAATHGIPFDGAVYETIAVTSMTSPEHPGVTWVDSWEEALLCCTDKTRVIIFGENVPREASFRMFPIIKIRSPPLFLITVRGPEPFCHIRASSWMEALRYARGFTG